MQIVCVLHGQVVDVAGDALAAEAEWLMSRFIQSLVNRRYVNVASVCWWEFELVVVRGLDCYSIIWSATTENTGASPLMLELLQLGVAGVCWLVIQVSAAWGCRWLLLGDAGTCAAGVIYKSGWLQRRRLVVSAKGFCEKTRGDPQKTFRN